MQNNSVTESPADSTANINSKTESGEMITREKAKQIALSDAGLTETNIRAFEIELDYERGEISYEIEFIANKFEYSYDIHAYSGKIISCEKPAKQTTPTVTKETAKAAALNHAGVKEGSVREYEIELSNENVLHYEIEFTAERYEYSYEINAITGEILKHHKELND